MRGLRFVLSSFFVVLLFLFLSSLVFAAVPAPPPVPSLPEDSLLNERDPSPSSIPDNVIGSSGISGGNFSPKRPNASRPSPSGFNVSVDTPQSSGDSSTSDNSIASADSGDDSSDDGDSSLPETQGAASNLTITIILFITGALVIVAIFLLVRNVFGHKKPVLPSPVNGYSRPINGFSTVPSQPAVVRSQRIVQPVSQPSGASRPVQQYQPLQGVQRPFGSPQQFRPLQQSSSQSSPSQPLQYRPSPVLRVDDNTKSLAEYLSNSFKAGHTIDSLMPVLSSSGWNSDDVRNALGYLKSRGGS